MEFIGNSIKLLLGKISRTRLLFIKVDKWTIHIQQTKYYRPNILFTTISNLFISCPIIITTDYRLCVWIKTTDGVGFYPSCQWEFYWGGVYNSHNVSTSWWFYDAEEWAIKTVLCINLNDKVSINIYESDFSQYIYCNSLQLCLVTNFIQATCKVISKSAAYF